MRRFLLQFIWRKLYGLMIWLSSILLIRKSPAGRGPGATLLIIVISAIVLAMVKKSPYLFVGWLWYLVTILPVIGIIQVGNHAMADRYHYLPSVGWRLLWHGERRLDKKQRNKKKYFISNGNNISCRHGITGMASMRQLEKQFRTF